MKISAAKDAFRKKLQKIRILACDVDGVLTDGRLYFSANGDELKAFNILDGLGMKQLQSEGIKVVLITGRSSPLTERRARDLGLDRLIQGREDKLTALKEVLDTWQFEAAEAAYIGDDLPDLPAIRYAGVGFSVPNGYWLVREHADYVTTTEGGCGAVREVTDLILEAKGLLDGKLAAALGGPGNT